MILKNYYNTRYVFQKPISRKPCSGLLPAGEYWIWWSCLDNQKTVSLQKDKASVIMRTSYTIFDLQLYIVHKMPQVLFTHWYRHLCYVESVIKNVQKGIQCLSNLRHELWCLPQLSSSSTHIFQWWIVENLKVVLLIVCIYFLPYLSSFRKLKDILRAIGIKIMTFHARQLFGSVFSILWYLKN